MVSLSTGWFAIVMNTETDKEKERFITACVFPSCLFSAPEEIPRKVSIVAIACACG
jgi:hypothetical protein